MTYGTKQHTRRYGRDEHVMNKNEAAVMRRLQSMTGLSEEEIRAHKKYRKMLSAAQAVMKLVPGTEGDRGAKRLLKRVTRSLKLAIRHPDTIAAAMKSAEEYEAIRSWRLPHSMVHYMKKLLDK